MRAFPRFPAALSLMLLLAAAGCRAREDAARDAAAVPAATAQLAAQAAQFPRGVVEVAPGVHVATGYGLANSVMIVGDGGVVIVDTMESAEAAAEVRDAFRRISSAPVRAIVYTHNHADHVFGAATLAGDDRPEVIAHATFRAEFDRIVTATRETTWRRAMRQFGTRLPDEDSLNCGIGPALRHRGEETLATLAPTRTFDGERAAMEFAGVRLELLHAPGETPDQIVVWLPDRRVLVAGDNYYQSFPNLYAIRGTAYRDVMLWVRSIDRMRELGADVLVPMHTLPVRGADEVRERLTDYRDAIQFVHDQTVRGMNAGRGPLDIAATLRLPPSLASKPWLAEHYGRVDWSSRGIFDGYLGWFGGDAADLSPLTAAERASRTAALAGGSERLREAASAALQRGDARWALELAGHLVALGEGGMRDDAMRIRAAALRALAAREPSANGRNYYLTQALEAEERVVLDAPDPSRLPDDLLASIPVSSFLRAMTVRVDPAKAEGLFVTVGLRFPDLGEDWSMRVRNSVVELQQGAPRGADMTVTCDSRVWKEILTGKRNATAAFATGAVQVDRNRLELVRFLFLFR